MVFLNPKSPSAIWFLTDAYKLDHRRQYPEGTESVYSNFTARGSRVEGVNHTVHFGLQAFIRDVLMDGFKTFFEADVEEALTDYKRKLDALLGPNDIDVEHIRKVHELGYLPLRFCGVPEGTPVPLRVPSFTVESTSGPEFFWVTNYFETVISASYWLPSTTATTAWNFRRVLDQAALETTGSTDGVGFQGHDFSFRGMSSVQSAAASGAAHLTSFTGTDSLVAIDWIDYFYPGDNGFIAGSVPATEHAVMCAGGEEDELKTFDRLLDLYPSGILSIVSDTWDFFAVLTELLPELQDKIEARDGKLVIRPDSGDPTDIICGTERDFDKAQTPEEKGAIQLLWELFGGRTNELGYKLLADVIGLIYGDSINLERAKDINARLAAKGFASTNWVAGIGSFTYQFVTRDTFGSAMKATQVVINGESRNIFKNPKTDNGLKKSATGRLAVLSKMSGKLYLQEKATPEQEASSFLQPVWENGEFIPGEEISFAEVRENLIHWTGVLTRNGSI